MCGRCGVSKRPAKAKKPNLTKEVLERRFVLVSKRELADGPEIPRAGSACSGDLFADINKLLVEQQDRTSQSTWRRAFGQHSFPQLVKDGVVDAHALWSVFASTRDVIKRLRWRNKIVCQISEDDGTVTLTTGWFTKANHASAENLIQFINEKMGGEVKSAPRAATSDDLIARDHRYYLVDEVIHHTVEQIRNHGVLCLDHQHDETSIEWILATTITRCAWRAVDLNFNYHPGVLDDLPQADSSTHQDVSVPDRFKRSAPASEGKQQQIEAERLEILEKSAHVLQDMIGEGVIEATIVKKVDGVPVWAQTVDSNGRQTTVEDREAIEALATWRAEEQPTQKLLAAPPSETNDTTVAVPIEYRQDVLRAGRLMLLVESQHILVDGHDVTLTDQQCEFLKTMFQLHNEGIVESSPKDILKRAGISQEYSEHFRSRDLFKSRPGLWSRLVKSLRRGSRGTLRLKI